MSKMFICARICKFLFLLFHHFANFLFCFLSFVVLCRPFRIFKVFLAFYFSNYVIKCSDCSKNNENEFHTSEKSNSKFFEESPSTVNANVKCSNNAVVNSPNSKKINNSPKSYDKNCLESSKKVSPNNKSKVQLNY